MKKMFLICLASLLVVTPSFADFDLSVLDVYEDGIEYEKIKEDRNGMFNDGDKGEWITKFSYGTIKGESFCASTWASHGSTGDPRFDEWDFNHNCWCRVTGFSENGSDFEDLDSTSWVFNFEGEKEVPDEKCYSDCTESCANELMKSYEFRMSMYRLF